MKKFNVTFEDVFAAESEEDCYKELLIFLGDCVRHDDVTAFEFKEVKDNATAKAQHK